MWKRLVRDIALPMLECGRLLLGMHRAAKKLFRQGQT